MTSPSARRRLLPWALTVVFVLVTGLVIVSNLGDGEPPGSAPCDTRTPIVVASSTEKSDLLSRLAEVYNGAPGRCGRVEAVPRASGEVERVPGVNSGEAATAFTRGWQQTFGFRPDVWTPASSLWAGVALTGRDAGGTVAAEGVVPSSGPSLARSPLVFALPESVARRLGWPDASLGWADLARLSTDPQARAARGLGASFTLGKTNPEVSTSGLHALLTAFAATPGQGDVLGRAAVDAPVVKDFERSIEGAVVHYGNTEQEFLSNMTDAAARPGGASSYVNAVAVEEKSVWDYNQGNPGALADRPRAAPLSERLVAFSPREGTLVSDSPYLTLTWPDTTPAKRVAAEDFRRWLTEPAQQSVFRANGFRDVEGNSDGQLTVANGFPPGSPRVLPSPSAETVTRARDLWSDELRKPANVTLVFDTSRSMRCDRADPPPPPGMECAEALAGRTRLDAVREAADRAVARLRTGDTLSVRTFSTTTRTDAPPVGPTVVGPEGSLDSARNIVARAFPPNFEPAGGTALYQAARETVAGARATAEPNRINAVVLLTDGDESQEKTQEAVERTKSEVAADPSRPVRLFFIAYSRDAGKEVGSYANLEQIAFRAGGYTYDARVPSKIDQIFNDVISNF